MAALPEVAAGADGAQAGHILLVAAGPGCGIQCGRTIKADAGRSAGQGRDPRRGTDRVGRHAACCTTFAAAAAQAAVPAAGKAAHVESWEAGQDIQAGRGRAAGGHVLRERLQARWRWLQRARPIQLAAGERLRMRRLLLLLIRWVQPHVQVLAGRGWLLRHVRILQCTRATVSRRHAPLSPSTVHVCDPTIRLTGFIMPAVTPTRSLPVAAADSASAGSHTAPHARAAVPPSTACC